MKSLSEWLTARSQRRNRKVIERLLGGRHDPRRRVTTIIPSAEGTRYAFTERVLPTEETSSE